MRRLTSVMMGLIMTPVRGNKLLKAYSPIIFMFCLLCACITLSVGIHGIFSWFTPNLGNLPLLNLYGQMSLVGDVCIILTEKIFNVVCLLTVGRGRSALQQRLLNVNLSIAANVCRRKPRPFALRTTLTMLLQDTSAHYDENSRLKIRDPGWRKRYCCWHLTNDVTVTSL